MADSIYSVWETMCLPFSGDVTQPWSWLYQFAPITINQMKTENPALEKRIVNEVASYGKQLGKLVEAVQVLARNLDTSKLGSDEKTCWPASPAWLTRSPRSRADMSCPGRTTWRP